MTAALEHFEEQRPHLLGLAYRMLADTAEAQDVVQDAWLRWDRTQPESVDRPAAFLHRTVTRLCLDRLKSARVRREQYVGPWLPEPLATGAHPGHDANPESALALADDLSFALLLALERLTPTERAAFLLHDVFDHDYTEIATTLDRTEAACRQLVSRARRHVRTSKLRGEAVAPALHRELLERFVAACMSGDTTALSELLREDAVQLSDGGGQVVAALKPIEGARAITRFQIGLRELHLRNGSNVEAEVVELNGEPALLVWVDEVLAQAVLIGIDRTRIARIFAVRNPDKLSALSTRYVVPSRRSSVADAAHLERRSRDLASGGPDPGDHGQPQ